MNPLDYSIFTNISKDVKHKKTQRNIGNHFFGTSPASLMLINAQPDAARGRKNAVP